MNKYIVLSEKIWHEDLFQILKEKYHNDSWLLINRKEEFNISNLQFHQPTKIFIPHWSHIIPKEIYENYECLVFHMTDLPFGRGGSPLQNLIVRGFKSTKISAIKVEKGIDTGPVYLKRELNLEGTATTIFKRSTSVIKEMIFQIIDQNIKPIAQFGEITEFKRRKPEESNMMDLNELDQVYDYIRMLDCEGYPNAYVETKNFKIEFFNADLKTNEKTITAHVRIVKK
jgi:methionyl-tRNA formyltransferase